MSYCRFSSDNFKSDVYVYAHIAGGFMTHVAANRIVGGIPPDVAYRDFMAEPPEREPIGGPHDGESFATDSIEETIELLRDLQSKGYHVPTHAFERLNNELEEVEP
jgi:hypothetical protein